MSAHPLAKFGYAQCDACLCVRPRIELAPDPDGAPNGLMCVDRDWCVDEVVSFLAAAERRRQTRRAKR